MTSQLFANIYLNELDQFIKHELKVKYYIRYTDDFVIVHHNPEHLLWLKHQIKTFLQTRLRLELHPHKVSLRQYRQGIDFLGYVLLPGAQVLRTKTKRRLTRKIHERIRLFKNGSIPEAALAQTLHSYFAVLGHGTNYRLEQALRQEIWWRLKSPEA